MISPAIFNAVSIGMEKASVVEAPLLEGEAGRSRRVHADHLPATVHQRATGVARLDVGVRLDKASQVLGGPVTFVARGDGLVEGGDAAVGIARSAAAPPGVADPDNLMVL